MSKVRRTGLTFAPGLVMADPIMETKSKSPVVIWLLTGCVLIFAMVVVGGITRLTQSGLSIVEWNLFTGVVPPTSPEAWQILYEKYQTSPQYQLRQEGFTLDQFKSIFWWEYIHRLLGRFIGLVFAIPFLYFLIRKKLNSNLLKKLIVILLLGAFQGVLGWYMVKSGLVRNPFVSHYRLAAHLLTAFATFGYTFWVALGLMYPTQKEVETGVVPQSLKRLIYLLFGFVILQITYGAFVAGLHAGRIYNTFPLMDGSLFPAVIYQQSPFWKNLFESHAGVQFIHRYLAYILVILVGIVFYKSQKMNLNTSLKKGFTFLAFMMGLQFLLGVFTLLYAAPILLGVLHQAGAFALLTTMIFILFHLKPRW